MATLNIKPIKDRTLRANVVEQLREAIISGDLPPGTQLVELQLSKLLGVSRGPLREAIRELVDQGLIENIPYTGTYVSSITTKKIDELYTLRTQLERFAFTLLWPIKTQQFEDELHFQHKKLLRAIEDNDSYAAITEELELHNTVYRHCNHELLLESWYRLRGRLHFYFTLHQKAHQRSGPLMGAHDEYVALACKDDLDAMLMHVDSHMQQGYAKVQQLVTSIETNSE